MIFKLNNALKLIKRHAELAFLILLTIITISSTTLYNNHKKIINKNYINLVNNIYFQKSISHIFNKLKPRYKNVQHKISTGETFNKILSNYSITNKEIIKIKKNLTSDYNLNNLKTNLIIKFTIDESNNKKITSFIFPLSRTKKIQLTRSLEKDTFKKKIIITNLNRKVIFKEEKIQQSLYKTAINLDIQPNMIIEFARIYGFQVDF